MYNGKTTSLKTILWKVMNNPLAADLTYDLAAEYVLEGIKLIGAPLSLINKVSNPPIEVSNNKAALPYDLVELKGVRAFSEQDAKDYEKIELTYATNLYHANKPCDGECEYTEATYTAEEGIIKTSFPNGYIEVAYKALPVDEDGFPLVPDNYKVLLALEYHVLYRFLEPLYLVGKITDKAFDHIAKNKFWYIGAANTEMQLSGYDHIEAIMNTVNRLIINTNAHANFFKGTGKQERLRRY
jgi:hypothetical protein